LVIGYGKGSLQSGTVNIDGLIKSYKIRFPVIPAKVGIQSFQAVADHLDSSRTRSGICRSDDFLRMHQTLNIELEDWLDAAELPS